MQRWWVCARPSASDEGQISTASSKFRRYRAPQPLQAVRRFSRSPLAGALTFAFAIPLLAGAWEVHSADATPTTPPADFSKPEPGEDKPGGGATSRGSLDNADAFSHSSGNLDFKRELDFKIGNAIFRKNWVSAPSSTDASDGLGPLFNSRACQACHLKDGRGHPPLTEGVHDDSHSMLLRLSVPPKTVEEKAKLDSHAVNSTPEPTYGGQLQDLSIQGVKSEGGIEIQYEEKPVKLAGGETVNLRAPKYSIGNLGYGPLADGTMISPRVAPPMIGLGLLEAVPEDQILTGADPDDANNDGVSGKPNQVWSRELNQVTLGRFGWKAGVPSIAEQTAGAANGDIGLSSTMIATASGDCTEKQQGCLDAPNGNSPAYQNVELGDDLFKMVVFYSHNLAVPARRTADDSEVLKGKALFHATGCAGCHRPNFTTGDAKEQPHLSNQSIWPYTDLLLHDMGEGLADNRPDGAATGSEWRTSPLWGIGLTETVNGHTLFLHDGRARNIKEAILWHGGEAETSRDAFAKLSKEDRERLIAFVNSL